MDQLNVVYSHGKQVRNSEPMPFIENLVELQWVSLSVFHFRKVRVGSEDMLPPLGISHQEQSALEAADHVVASVDNLDSRTLASKSWKGFRRVGRHGGKGRFPILRRCHSCVVLCESYGHRPVNISQDMIHEKTIQLWFMISDHGDSIFNHIRQLDNQ